MNKNEVNIIVDLKIREELMEKFGADENKEVFSLLNKSQVVDGTNFATTKQVATFFGSTPALVRKKLELHKDELISDGVVHEKYTHFNCEKNSQLGNKEYRKEIGFDSNYGTSLFTKRAILRLAMILPKSEIAKKIRDYLLIAEEGFTTAITKGSDSLEFKNIQEDAQIALAMIAKMIFAVRNGSTAAHKRLEKEIEKNDIPLSWENPDRKYEPLAGFYKQINNKINASMQIKGFKKEEIHQHAQKFNNPLIYYTYDKITDLATLILQLSDKKFNNTTELANFVWEKLKEGDFLSSLKKQLILGEIESFEPIKSRSKIPLSSGFGN